MIYIYDKNTNRFTSQEFDEWDDSIMQRYNGNQEFGYLYVRESLDIVESIETVQVDIGIDYSTRPEYPEFEPIPDSSDYETLGDDGLPILDVSAYNNAISLWESEKETQLNAYNTALAEWEANPTHLYRTDTVTTYRELTTDELAVANSTEASGSITGYILIETPSQFEFDMNIERATELKSMLSVYQMAGETTMPIEDKNGSIKRLKINEVKYLIVKTFLELQNA